METDGGGWTVFQRRKDGSVDFNRSWVDYERGFGNLSGEFWLGLSKVHRLARYGINTLRVDLGDFENNTAYAQYSTFTIGDDLTKYILNVGRYNGTAGDALTTGGKWPYHINNGMKFSTKDNDNDNHGSLNCAARTKGGWWFNACFQCHLNAPYYHGGSVPMWRGIIWYDWKGHSYSLKFTEMKVRRN